MAWFSRSGRVVRAILGVSEAGLKRRPISRDRSLVERLLIEPLEERVVPSTVNWINSSGGDWDNPANWSTGAVPGAADSVVIPNVASPVTHSQSIHDSVSSITTSGDLTLSGGTLTVLGTISFMGLAPTPEILLQGGTLTNATIASGATLTLSNSGGVLSGIFVNGVIDGTQPAVQNANSPNYNYADVTGGMILNGSIYLGGQLTGSPGQLYFDKTQSLMTTLVNPSNGQASVVFGQSTENAIYSGGPDPTLGSGSAILTIGTGVSIVGGNGIMAGSGTVGGYSVTNDSLINNGTIESLDSGSDVTLSAENLTNFGEFAAIGGTISISTGTTFTNFSAGSGSLTSGRLLAESIDGGQGLIEFPGAAITTDTAAIVLVGAAGSPSPEILNSTTQTNALTTLTAVSPGSLLSLTDTSLTLSGPLINQGLVYIDATDAPATLNVGGSYTQNASGITASPSQTEMIAGAVLQTLSTVTLNSGGLDGYGTIIGNLVNDAAVTPGEYIVSPKTANPTVLPGPGGPLTVQGNYTQGSTGALNIYIAGDGQAGADYSEVDAAGTATLNGAITINSFNGFVPLVSETFQIIDFKSSSGDFTAKSGFSLPGPAALAEDFTAKNLTLLADPSTGVSLGVTATSIVYNANNTQQAKVVATLYNPYATVGAGNVQFYLTDQSGDTVAASVSGGVTTGTSTVSFLIPAGTPAGTYVVTAQYGGTAQFLAGTAISTLVISPAATTLTVASVPKFTYSLVSQTVPLTASVTSNAGKVNEGTVVFTVFNGTTEVGFAVSSPVTAGSATANFVLPAGTLPGTYTIQANYADSSPGNYQPSTNATQPNLVVAPGAATVVTGTTINVAYSPADQTVNLVASVASSNQPVFEGSATFTIVNASGTTVGLPVTVPVSGGVARTPYTLPGGTGLGTYSIQISYTDPTGLFLNGTDNTHSLTVVPAEYIWTSLTGGDWDTATNWSTDQVPGANDLAIIPQLTGNIVHARTNDDAVAGIISSGNINLSAGSITVYGDVSLSNGATLTLLGGTLAGATFESGSVLRLSSEGGSLENITISDGAEIDGTQKALTGGNNRLYNYVNISGGLSLDGEVYLGAADGSSAAQLFFIKTQNIVSGSGTVVIGDAANGSNGNAIYSEGENSNGTEPASLIIGNSISIYGGNALIAGFYSTDTIVNNGHISASGGGTLLFDGGQLTNFGTLTVAPGATMTVGSNTDVTNYNPANQSIVGGTFIIQGTFNIPVMLNGNSADLLELSGPDGQVLDNGVNALSYMTFNSGGFELYDASLTILPQTPGVPNAFTNSGGIILDGSAGPTVLNITSGPFQQSVASPGFTNTDLVGGGILEAVSATFTTSGQGFSNLEGSGTIIGDVTNAGTVEPQDLTIQGNYTQTSGGTMVVTLAGANTAGISYSTITVTKAASLAGALTVTEVGNFTPSLGDSYVIMSFASSSGAFPPAMTKGLAAGNLALDQFFSSTALTLRADPSGGTSLGVAIPPLVFNNTVKQTQVNVDVYVSNPFAMNTGGYVGVVVANSGATIGPILSNTAAGTIVFPGVLAAGTYPVYATYAGIGGAFLASTAVSTLVVLPAPTMLVSPTVGPTLSYSLLPQTLSFTADVTSSGGVVGEGNVTFTVVDSSGNTIGTPVIAPVTKGAAVATYTLPAQAAFGTYEVEETYSDSVSGDFTPSTATGTLTTFTVSKSAVTTTVASAATVGSSAANQSVTLSAAVTSSDLPVFEGTVTFTIVNSKGVAIGAPAIGNVVNGVGTATYVLPANTPLGTYEIEAQYDNAGAVPYFQTSSDDTQLLSVVKGAVYWINPAGGDWDTPTNWSIDAIPGPNDDVVINQTTGPITHFGTANDTVADITSAANIALGAGTLTVEGDLSLTAGSVLYLNGGTLASATLNGPTRIQLSDQGGTLSGVIVSVGSSIDGSQAVPVGGTTPYNYATVLNGLTVDGTLILGSSDGKSAGELFFNGTQNLLGTGAVILGASPQNALFARGVNPANGTGPASLIIGTGLNIDAMDGVIGGYYSTDSLVNAGNITTTGSVVLQGSKVGNSGLFAVAPGATLSIAPGSNFTNFSAAGSALAGGAYQVAGTFEFGGAAIGVDAASIELDGPSAQILNSTTGANALSPLAGIGAGGVLTLDGISMTTASPLVNNGTLQIEAILGPATLTVPGSITQSNPAGSMAVSSTVLIAGGIINTPVFTLTSGILAGDGTIIGNVSSAGTVSPGQGAAPGAINIQGAYTQAASGTLAVELAGSVNAGSDYSQLNANTMALSGTISVNLATGYAPALGNSFEILQFASSSGDFITKKGFASTGIALSEAYSANNMTLLANPTNGVSLGISAPPITYRANASQNATVTALIFNPTSTVAAGIVSFSLTDQNGQTIAPSVVSTTVSNSTTTGTFVIPAGTPAGTYIINASYNGGGIYLPDTAVSTLTILPESTKIALPSKAVTTPYSLSSQMVNLSATVTSTSSDIVNEGVVTFTLFNSTNQQVGTATIVPVVAGAAGGQFTLPGGLLPGSYTVQAVYSDSSQPTNFLASPSASQTLMIVIATTTTTVPTVIVPLSSNPQTVAVTADVTSAAGIVDEGSVLFTITAGFSNQTFTANVVNGVANASYTVPGGLAIGIYPISAVFTDATGGGFTASSTTGQLSVRVPTTLSGSSAIVASFNESPTNLNVGAIVSTSIGSPFEGTISFQVVDSNNNPVGSPSSPIAVVNGSANGVVSLPGNTPPGTYSIIASYSDANGVNYASSTGKIGTVTVVPAAVTTFPGALSVPFNQNSQNVRVTTTIFSAAGAVNDGTVSFTIVDSHNNVVGIPLSGIAVSNSSASATYVFPAGTPVGTYTLQVVYSVGSTGFFTAGSGNSKITVTGANTTTSVSGNTNLAFSESDRSLPVNATVDSVAGTINEGTVTFTLINSNGVAVDASVVSGVVTNGMASATLDVPAGTPAGSYTIQAQYSDTTGPNYLASTDKTHTLTIANVGSTVSTTNALATYSATAQTITLSATVTSAAGNVSEGNVVFTILDSSYHQVGSQTAGGGVTNGMATATYSLPAGTPVATYTIQVQYTDTNPGDFQTSNGTPTILYVESGTSVSTSNVVVKYSDSSQNLSLSATVSSPVGPVYEGNVTFTILDSKQNPVGSAVSGAVSGGSANATYVLPAGTASGTYTLAVSYADTGTSFHPSTDSSKTVIVQGTATTVTASPATGNFNQSNPPITFTANVHSAAGPVNEGTVTFTVMSGTTIIGSPVTSPPVANGAANASFILPLGTPAGTYTILAQYQDSAGNLLPANNVGNLAVLTVVQSQTTVSLPAVSVASSLVASSVILHANVASSGGMINEGTVTFEVFSGNTQIGSAVTSATVGGSSAKATFIVPAGTPAGTYTVQATFNGSTNFDASAPATGTLVLDLTPVLPQINSLDSVELTRNQFPYSTMLNGSSPIGLPVNYSATVLGDNPLYDIQSQFHFQGVGFYNGGAPGYAMYSTVVNSFGNNYYLLNPNGGIYAYDGSGSYAHSYANGSAVATAGPNAYTDPTLLLNAQPPVDYPTLYGLQQQYQFKPIGYYTVGGATAYVLSSSVLNSFGNPFYLISSSGGLFPYDYSGSYAHTFLNVTPLASLSPTVYTNPSGLLNAEAAPALYAQLYQLNQQFDLQELNGSFYTNNAGHQAQWIYSPVLNQYGQHWYTLTLSSDGTQAILRAWEGYNDSATGAVVATLDPSVYNNPSLLTNATAVPPPETNISVDASGHLSVAPATSSFVGTFKVIVTVSDGFLSTSQTLTVTSTDSAPTLTVQNGANTLASGDTVTFDHDSYPQALTFTTGDAENDSVSTSASVSAFSLPFALQQQYQFKGIGYYSNTASGYVLQAVGNNAFGNPYYVLSPTGILYAYDGNGGFADTYASVKPLAVLGANYYQDPTLLLNAQAPVDYATLYNLQQQYQFQGIGYYNFGAPAYVLHSNQPGAGFEGYYLLAPNGNLYADDSSGSYAHAMANSANLIASLDPSLYVNPSVLLNAQATPALYAELVTAEREFDLEELKGSFYTGNAGNAAKWLYSPILNAKGQNWYTLVLSADGSQALLYAYDGSGISVPSGAQPVATFDSSVYYNPNLLLNAKAPVAATGISASVIGDSIIINAPSSFIGTFQLTVTASDGALSMTQTFEVTSQDTPPVPTAVSAQTASQSGSPLQITLSSTDAESDSVTYSAAVSGYSPAYNLQQVYQFQGIAYYTNHGVTAYVLSSNVMDGAGGGYYLLTSTGAVYAYDGSGNYASSVANNANLIAQLDPSVYTAPTLLTNAQPAAVPAASVSVANNTLLVNVSNVPVGTIFEILVTVSDGAETSRMGFLVTVTS